MWHDLCITPLARRKHSCLGEVLGDRRAVISCDSSNSLHQVQNLPLLIGNIGKSIMSLVCGHPQAIRIAQLLSHLMSLHNMFQEHGIHIIEVIRCISSPKSCSIPLLGGFLAAIPREVFLGPLSAPWVSQHYLSGPLFSPSKWHGVPATHRPSNFTARTKPVLRFCSLCVECVCYKVAASLVVLQNSEVYIDILAAKCSKIQQNKRSELKVRH